MRLPRDRIVEKHMVDAFPPRSLDPDSTPEHVHHLQQLFLLHILLTDKHGRITVEQMDLEAPRLLELGTVVVRPFKEDSTMVRVSFRPSSPTLAAIRPTRTGRRPHR